jgi:hypothetical protein
MHLIVDAGYNSSATGAALGPNGYNPERTNQGSVLENASARLSIVSSLVFFFAVTMLFM